MTRLGLLLDLELEWILCSATRTIFNQLKEQWLRHLKDHRLLAANLIVFEDWLESTAFIHEGKSLKQPNSKFHSCEKPKPSTFASTTEDFTKPKNSKCPFIEGKHAIWSCEEFKTMKLKERKNMCNVQKFRLCFNCLRPGNRSKDCNSRTCSMTN